MRRLLSTLLIIACSAACNAQALMMRDVFKSMPDSVVPYLSENNRLDLMDFWDSGMPAEVKNAFDGKTVLKKMTADYLRLQMNDAALIEMRLLHSERVMPDSTNQIVCVVRTFGANKRQSMLDFYTSKWLPLSKDSLIKPVGDAFFARPDTMSTERYEQMVKSIHVVMEEYTLSDTLPTLVITPQTILIANDKEDQITAILKSKTLKWDGLIFNIY